jgi:hypothetical protein
VGIAIEEVEAWRHDGPSDLATDGFASEIQKPLPPPPPDVPHLTIHVRMKPPPQTVAPSGTGEPEIPERGWEDLEGRWKAILDLEGSMDTLRISMEGLRAEMEASTTKTLTTEEKVHAFNADVAQWNKGKSRVIYALPKMRDYIHRATWAVGTPEKKKLEEIYKHHIRPRVHCPEIDEVGKQLDDLLKDRQALSAHGTLVYQECKRIFADLQSALSRLQTNAAMNAARKQRATREGGKFFKSIRRWSGAE